LLGPQIHEKKDEKRAHVANWPRETPTVIIGKLRKEIQLNRLCGAFEKISEILKGGVNR
jgi:hypothetical protein